MNSVINIKLCYIPWEGKAKIIEVNIYLEMDFYVPVIFLNELAERDIWFIIYINLITYKIIAF